MELQSPIADLPRTSPVTIKRLQAIGIETIWDLLNYFPFRYEDYSLTSPIGSVQEGEIVTIKGTVRSAKNLYARRGMVFQKVEIQDETGKIEAAWYNQPYIIRVFPVGAVVSVAGLIKKFGKKMSIEPREYDVMTNQLYPIHTGRLVPVYSEKYGLSSRTIREKMFPIHSLQIDDPLPPDIISQNSLVDESAAYRNIHFPKTLGDFEKAKERLSFDEVFFLELSSNLIKNEWKKKETAFSFQPFEAKIAEFIKNLPFALTSDQIRSIEEIKKDLKTKKPMNRFLQGDVGSGKTVVAAAGSYLAFLNGKQTLFMAPTEILAEQHFQTLSTLLTPYGMTVGIQTRTHKAGPKNQKIKLDVIVGTHALLNKDTVFEDVGLVVIDEQHRFGVAQRALLKKKGTSPHLLTMTATPIPRTVSLIFYGELQISILSQMPKGRLPIKTYLVPFEKREKGYAWIQEKIMKEKIQVFIVCPLIEESEVETMKSVKAAKKEYEHLQKHVFPNLKVGLLHGKIKSKEKQEMMNNFRERKYDILVTTSVVEVGIDIPNATIMLIEGAERFGLAQLHQLRGRVGRGSKQSFTFLFTDKEEPAVKGRLEFFAKTTSGIRLAEYDSKRRGRGDIYGMKQHGFAETKIADLNDFELIKKVTTVVSAFMREHTDYLDLPLLKSRLVMKDVSTVARD